MRTEATMHSISVELNGIRIATIGLARMDVVNVSVHGALDIEHKAMLHAMGSNYAEGGCRHLIWIAERTLLPGDIVDVRLHADGDGGGDVGKTIAELYPDEPPCTITDFSISADMAETLRSRPRLHERFVVQAEASSAQRVRAASDALNTDFTFGVLWDRFEPARARVRLTTHCLDDVLARTGGRQHLRTMLSADERASFSLLV